MRGTGLSDIHLVHRALPGIDMDEVDTSVVVGGKALLLPVIINAMTGGHRASYRINRCLAQMAATYGLGMAVGSQQAGLDEEELRKTYTVARQVNPEGLLLANISATAPPDLAVRAVEMIEADGLQLHFNVVQELAMPEGDRHFKGVLENVQRIVARVNVPVIAKETGCGMSREDALLLAEAGVSMVDVGGRGGTNFVEWEEWGIPTAISLFECLSVPGLEVMASGGIRSAIEIVKCLAAGALVTGMAHPFLKLAVMPEEDVRRAIRTLDYQLRSAMVSCGCRTVRELKQIPVVVTGFTAEWLRSRGIDLPPR